MVGVVDYEENLTGDLNYLIDNCGNKDLFITIVKYVLTDLIKTW